MKKLLLIIGLCTIILAIIFWRQVKRAQGIVTTAEVAPLISFENYPLPILSSDPLRGNPGAPLTLVIFADLGDAASKKILRTLAAFVDAHPSDARLAWKDLPKSQLFSPANLAPHVAAWCAGAQGKFWQYADQLAARPTKAGAKALRELAAALKLNLTEWQQCLSSGTMEPGIDAGASLAAALGLKNPPALFANNKRVRVDQAVDLEQMLMSLIAK